VNPAELTATLLDAVRATVRATAGNRAGEVEADDVTLERPRNRDHGDWASNVALKLGKRLGLDPREFAASIATPDARSTGSRAPRSPAPAS
jgi:arginyl-tRNA synthetase (EC 6.1.1.19)